jgi:hypothetical protein
MVLANIERHRAELTNTNRVLRKSLSRKRTFPENLVHPFPYIENDK